MFIYLDLAYIFEIECFPISECFRKICRFFYFFSALQHSFPLNEAYPKCHSKIRLLVCLKFDKSFIAFLWVSLPHKYGEIGKCDMFGFQFICLLSGSKQGITLFVLVVICLMEKRSISHIYGDHIIYLNPVSSVYWAIIRLQSTIYHNCVRCLQKSRFLLSEFNMHMKIEWFLENSGRWSIFSIFFGALIAREYYCV